MQTSRRLDHDYSDYLEVVEPFSLTKPHWIDTFEIGVIRNKILVASGIVSERINLVSHWGRRSPHVESGITTPALGISPHRALHS